MTHDELIERVTKATEGSYFLDEDLHIIFGDPERGLFDPPDAGRGEQVSHTDAGAVWKINRWSDGASSSVAMPKYTASIDAALALLERVLPGWFVSHIGEDFTFPPKARMGWTVELEKASAVEEGIFQGQAPTLPRAIILALLNAKKEITNVL